LWSCRKVGADEAKELGLVNRLCAHDDLIPACKSYIKELADSAAPSSLMIMKQQVYRHLNMTLGEAMKETNRLMNESLERDDFREGVQSFIEKRPPRFEKIKVD
ncbi:MAG: enoyl-CoA hydratase, partial [Pseudomonadales bacterium]|nr:enoyl-CoA hydratase [Pseudomonadales bacterium]